MFSNLIKKIILFSVISILFFCLSCSQKTEKVMPVKKDITEMVFASGTLEVDEKYNLTAQAEGYLVQVNFDENSEVLKGQLLAIIDNPNSITNKEASASQLAIANQNITENSPALKQVEANMAFTKNKLSQDKLQAERYKRLWESNSIAKVEYENALLALENTTNNLASLESQYKNILQQAKQQQITQAANLKINTTNQKYNQIKALAQGTVLKRYKQVGDYIRRGDIIATIGNKNTIIARINVDENSMGKIQIGQKTFVQLNTNKSEVFTAKIINISPVFEEVIQSFICEVTFDSILVRPIIGTQLEANILVGEKKQALLIPRNFLGFGNKVLVKGHKEPVIVKTGIISTEWAEIISGISETDELEIVKH